MTQVARHLLARCATRTVSSLVSEPIPITLHQRRKRLVSSAVTAAAADSTDPRRQSLPSSLPPPINEEGESYGLYRLLTANERNLLNEQRQLTVASRRIASQVAIGVGEDPELSSSLDQMLHQSSSFLRDLNLEATFSVVIAGEFNAGKSTLINGLVGTKLLETGALPTTDAITIVGHQPANAIQEEKIIDDPDALSSSSPPPPPPPRISSTMGVVVHSVPELPLLEDLTLIDTPGTNSAWMDHTERTMRLLPAADLILFVTSADRPFSDSERGLLQSIQAYRKNIVVVINKMDILDQAGGDHGREAKLEVLDFVTDKASELLGARPVVIPVSARDALSAKLMERRPGDDTDSSGNSGVWQRSNFAALESFLKESLTTQQRLKSKLSNPIGVAEGITVECLRILKGQRKELQVDITTLSIFQSQFEGWKKELEADLVLSRTAMTDMVRQEGERCRILLRRMHILRFYHWNIMDQEQLDIEWEDTKRAVSVHRTKDLKTDLLEQVAETADSVATRGRAQGQAVIEYLGKRPAMKNQSLVGSVTAASRFEDTRNNLREKLAAAVGHCLKADARDGPDKDRIFRELKQTALLSSVLNLGAAGSGLLLVFQAVDPMTGLLSMGTMAVGGGASYAMGTARIAERYQQQWSNRATSLEKELKAISAKELDRVNRRILDGVAPYTRFVSGEEERIDMLQEQCERFVATARTLRNRISKLV